MKWPEWTILGVVLVVLAVVLMMPTLSANRELAKRHASAPAGQDGTGAMQALPYAGGSDAPTITADQMRQLASMGYVADGGFDDAAAGLSDEEAANLYMASTSRQRTPSVAPSGGPGINVVDLGDGTLDVDVFGLDDGTKWTWGGLGGRSIVGGRAGINTGREVRHPDELWVIAKDTDQAAIPPGAQRYPTQGELRAKRSDGSQVPVPLKHTDVDASIAGYIATVDVTQEYQNPYSEKIEAVYVFPLPENAAVNSFLMTIGDRKIRGIIREREQAEKIYRAAKRRGHVASLLTQERPNIFTQSVANIEPAKEIAINIKYFHTLQSESGWYEFVFPMVVGPRYNPAYNGSNGVGPTPRDKPGQSGQKTEVAYLGPNETSRADVGLKVRLDAGVAIESLRSVNHQVSVARPSETQAEIVLSEMDDWPNKDFVLRYQVTGKQIKSALLTHEDERGGFFTLMLHPPESLADVKRGPMEMIFVLDCSGSMSGQPLQQAKAAVREALQMMRPQDSFQIIRFSSNASQLGLQPLPATPNNINAGLRYLKQLNGGGGTEMIEGIRTALDFPHDPERLRVVAFMTDGFIGNEDQIFKAVHDKLGSSRIFSFGVGQSPNRHLLSGLARMGRGTAAYLSLNDDAGTVMKRYFERVSHAALTDIAIDWGDLEVTSVFPQRVPDLFVGKPVVVTGRYRGTPGETIRVSGRAGGGQMDLSVTTGQRAAVRPGLPSVWARMQVASLAATAIKRGVSQAGEIRQVALEYGLMSAYTAFVAVDSLERTAGNFGTTVQVPVPVPAGVRYDTTVE